MSTVHHHNAATTRIGDSGQTYGVTVTVTKVEGINVKFDMKVDEAAQ